MLAKKVHKRLWVKHLVVWNDVNGVPAKEGSNHFPNKEHPRSLALSFLVRHVFVPPMVRVNRAPVGAANSLGRASGPAAHDDKG